jgi:hypothetical protein
MEDEILNAPAHQRSTGSIKNVNYGSTRSGLDIQENANPTPVIIIDRSVTPWYQSIVFMIIASVVSMLIVGIVQQIIISMYVKKQVKEDVKEAADVIANKVGAAVESSRYRTTAVRDDGLYI